MGKFIDKTGNTYRELTVLGRYSKASRVGNKKTLWTCICSCGNISNYSSSNLTTGNSTCCLDCRAEKQVSHGKARRGQESLEYRSWQHMNQRCSNPLNDGYSYYGGRGIIVCDRWNPDKGGSFQNFLEDMEERPCIEYTIDRIDVNGNYEPGNCRWADKSTQSLNRRKLSK